MAKQKGIHQLKGKVGGMSYYQQSGVVDGLVRRIPEGLSSRVKTADEYANTRLNNDEFKNANAMATFAFRAVPNRRASMMRRFAIAEMTKSALEFIKGGTGQWGQRIPTETFDNIMIDMLDRHSKSGPYAGEFGVLSDVIVGQNDNYRVELTITEEVANNLIAKGIDGFIVVEVRGCMCELVDSDGFVRQYFGLSSPSPHHPLTPEETTVDVTSFTLTPAAIGMSPSGYATAVQTPNNGMFAIYTFLPFRTIGTSNHTLYEYATFAIVSLGQIPE